MKLLFNLTKVVSAFVVLALLDGCGSTTTASNTSRKEVLLTQAGFKVKTVSTPKQQQLLAKLPADTVSTVKYKGTTYYVYPTGKTNQILVGKHPQFQAYRNLATAHPQASATHGEVATAPVNNYGTSTPIEVNPNPRGVAIEEFDGFGPMDDGSSW